MTYTGMGLSLVSAPMLAHTLGADGRGVLAGTFVVVQVIGWIAFLGLPNGLALQVEKRAEVSVWGLVFVTLLGAIAATIVFFAAPAISNDDPRIELGVRIVAFLLLFAGVSNLGDQLALLRGAVLTYNAVRAGTQVFPSLAIVILFLTGTLTLRAAFVVTLAGQVTAILIGLFVATSGVRGRAGAPVPWNFSIRLWVTTVFDSVGGRGDQLALTALTSAPVVGVYAIAVTCANAASGVAQALAQASMMHFVRASKAGEHASLGRLTAVATAATLTCGAGIVAVVTFYGALIFGPDFAALPPIVAVLVLAGLMQDVWKLRSARDSARERAGQLAAASAIGLAAMVGAIVVLTLLNAVTGLTMAFAFLVMCVSRLLSHLIISRRSAPSS